MKTVFILISMLFPVAVMAQKSVKYPMISVSPNSRTKCTLMYPSPKSKDGVWYLPTE